MTGQSAEDEAQRLWPEVPVVLVSDMSTNVRRAEWRRVFVAGAEWQVSQPVTVSADRVREAVLEAVGDDDYDTATFVAGVLAALGFEVTP